MEFSGVSVSVPVGMSGLHCSLHNLRSGGQCEVNVTCSSWKVEASSTKSKHEVL